MPALLARLTLFEPTASAAAASPWRWIGTALQLVWVVFLFALVLFLAYLTTRVVGRRFGTGGAGRYLRVIDSAPLGQNRSVALVEVGDEVYCVGVTEHGVSLLGKHERDGLTELAPREAAVTVPNVGTDFASLLAGFGGAARETIARLRPTRGGRPAPRTPATAPPPTAAPGATSGSGGDFAARMREQIARLQRLDRTDRSDGQGGPDER